MKKIGSGFEHNVFMLNDKKVIKKPTSVLFKVYKLITFNPIFIVKPLSLIDTFNSMSRLNLKSNNLIRYSNIPKKLFANPTFKGNTIIQTKVDIVKEKLSEENYEELIDEYIKLIYTLWSYGIHENVFNFTINCGISKNKKLMLIDFGEISNIKQDIIRDINSKKWLNSFSYKYHLNKTMKIYYLKQMEEYITSENLEKYWKSKA
jgi:hypothetical protein